MSKSIFLSKTFWGAVILLAAPFLKHFGITLGNESSDAITTALVGIVGFGITIYGRIKASKQVTILPGPPTGAKLAIVIFCLLIPCLFVGCIHKTARHVAAVGTNGIATILNTGVRLDAELHDAHEIDDAEAAEYAKLIDEAASDNDIFIDSIRSLPDSANKQQIVTEFSNFAQGIETHLETFHVKNPNAQRKINTFLQAVQIALAGISDFIQTASPQTTGKQLAAGITDAAQKGEQ